MSKDVGAYFQSKVDEASSAKQPEDLVELWRQARDLHAKKLWNQLTTVLDQLVARKELTGKPGALMELYQEAIAEFESK